MEEPPDVEVAIFVQKLACQKIVEFVSWFGLAVRCQAGKQRDLGLNPLLLSIKKLWSVDTVL